MRACSYSSTEEALMKLGGGVSYDDSEVFATLQKAAKEKDPEKLAQISKDGSVRATWKRLTTDVSTPRLILELMSDQKCTGDLASTMQAIVKKLTTKAPPINEADGEIMNMRTSAIDAMIKADVDPTEHFAEPKNDVEMVGARLYDTLRVRTIRFQLKSDSTCVHIRERQNPGRRGIPTSLRVQPVLSLSLTHVKIYDNVLRHFSYDDRPVSSI